MYLRLIGEFYNLKGKCDVKEYLFQILRCYFIFFIFLPLSSISQPLGVFENQISVGDDAFLGEADFFDDIYEILGSGGDIGGTADGLYWIYNELIENFIITADMEWAGQIIPGGAPNAGSANKKMGIVVREDPEAPGARNISAVLMNTSANNTNANM